jgi:hypothetical protein
MSEHVEISTKQKTNVVPASNQSKNIPIMQGSHPSAIIQKAQIHPESLTHTDVMQLQRTIGNQAVMQLFKDMGHTKPVQQNEPVQEKVEPSETVQKKENNTGLSDNLKSGVESLSGMDMSDVRVNYNSSKPAEVGALAYTQGTDIHVAPGEERHLPHEAWHVVQQKQGRVQPTIQMKGVAVNDDAGLEREADEMGSRAVSGQVAAVTQNKFTGNNCDKSNLIQKSGVVQRAETYYRTMSDVHYQTLVNTNKVSATGETFISPTLAFSLGYGGSTVKFEVNDGTTTTLEGIGVRDTSKLTRTKYPLMPIIHKGWGASKAFFKAEGVQINIGLGQGTALDTFNNNISKADKVVI